jgi:RNA polymerase sigma factor (sigma-70 family)
MGQVLYRFGTRDGGATSDPALLAEFVRLRETDRSASERAFRQLVERHADLVYSAAYRQTRSRDLAEEVTQAVFILLARKAEELAGKPQVVIGGWLHESARLTAKNAVRSRARRSRHEREAAARAAREITPGPKNTAWASVYPVLDECIGQLSERERAAVVLRFFEQKSLAETGTALGISEEAAQMRVGRAVAKLRMLLSSRCARVPEATALGGFLAVNVVRAAPPGVAEGAVELSLKAADVTGSPAFALAESVAAQQKLKLIAVTAGATVVSVVLLVLLYLWADHVAHSRPAPRPSPPVSMR